MSGKFNKGYEDLLVWKKSIEIAEIIYFTTKNFPKEETYGMVSQMRRSAVSVASNIAEGCARDSYKEFSQFLSIALGSLAELKTQLIISKRVNLLTEEKYEGIIGIVDEIRKMLNGLKRSLKSN